MKTCGGNKEIIAGIMYAIRRVTLTTGNGKNVNNQKRSDYEHRVT